MITIILLVLAVSLDSLSFGVGQGLNNKKIGLFNSIIMTILATILFTIPLYLSKLVVKNMDEDLCFLINGTVLLLLGLFYIITYIINKDKPKKYVSNDVNFKYYIISTFPITLDAIFTAFLNGYSLDNLWFAIFFFFIITFVSLYVGNLITIKLSKKFNLSLEWLSGIIFIILGIIKLLEI